MGLRILYPSGETVVIQPFAKNELTQQRIHLRCHLQKSVHQLIYAKPIKQKKNSSEFIVEFSVSAFQQVALTPALKDFLKKTRLEGAQSFSKQPLPLDAAMHNCIYAITHYVDSDQTKLQYLYVRAIELVLMQQESYLRSSSPKPVYVKTEYDKERIVFARDYLLTHMDAPPTLPKLAAIAGINEFKLKKGFRELFNNSVFGYLANVRLEMARTALQQKQKSVTQIAFELGYASLQHFSAAFKKKFGVAPARF
jgi:AraC family transcriptional activator of pyochelin receptor